MEFKRIAKVALQVAFIVGKINWVSFFRYYNKKSRNVIVPSFIAGRFGTELFCWDMAYIHALTKEKKSFRLVRNINKLGNHVIFWSPSKRMTNNEKGDYASELIDFAKKAEARGNILFPSSHDVSFLENKAFMYTFFEKTKIHTPQTYILDKPEQIEKLNLEYPVLLKGEHSAGSEAVYKFDSEQELKKFLKESDFLSLFEHIILQQLLNIRRDLRVTLVGKEVVLFYWRINPANEWRPTASVYGSDISFKDYPVQWNEYIVDAFERTGLGMGAFDVCWQNDDLSTEPYFLEVSPRFSPNPPVELEGTGMTYAIWKKNLIGKNVYYKLQTNRIFSIAEKYIITHKHFYKNN